MSLLKGLVGHWPLDEEHYNPVTRRVTDLSAYCNDGTSVNAANFVADRMGQLDRAMSFNGSTDYVDCGNDSSLNFGTGDFTLIAWMNSTSHQTRQGLFFKRDVINAIGFFCRLDSSGRLSFWIGDGGVQEFTTISNQYSDGQWHLVIVSVERSGRAVFYKDNIEDGGRDISGVSGSINNSIHCRIGREINPIDGSMAEARIYNRVLSSSERSRLYESYRPRMVIG